MENISYSNFKKMKVWQKSSELAIIMYEICESYPSIEKKRLADQTLRSTSSIMANIAEGCGVGYLKKEISHLYNALGSANESLSWIELAYKLKYINQDTYSELTFLFEEVIKMLHGLIKSKNKQLT